jgi:hypothetical protein
MKTNFSKSWERGADWAAVASFAQGQTVPPGHYDHTEWTVQFQHFAEVAGIHRAVTDAGEIKGVRRIWLLRRRRSRP